MDEGKLGFSSANNRVFINATHPGAVSTDQPIQSEEAYGLKGTIGVAMIRPFMKDPVKKGCRSGLFAATAEEVVTEGINGEYIVPDCKVTSPSDRAQDVELQERLWRLSVEILREKLGQLEYQFEV